MTTHHFSTDDPRTLYFGRSPHVVRERCPNPRCVNGTVEVRDINSGLSGLQLCSSCLGSGYQLREARDDD